MGVGGLVLFVVCPAKVMVAGMRGETKERIVQVELTNLEVRR